MLRLATIILSKFYALIISNLEIQFRHLKYNLDATFNVVICVSGFVFIDHLRLIINLSNYHVRDNYSKNLKK